MKTTKRQFKVFCDEFKRHIERFGLNEWRLDFVHEDCGDAFSTINSSYSEKVVTICFSDDWSEHCIPLSDNAIRDTALHEAIELLVSDLRALSFARFVTQDEIYSTSHMLVRRLEKLL